jgi:alpha-tubulin suppressor-like RCC1 family protein
MLVSRLERIIPARLRPMAAWRCWGGNTYGQLGNGTTKSSSKPVDVVNLGGRAVSLALGDYYSCALLSTGGVQCWGYNPDGRLGDGTNANKTSPTWVFGLSSGAVYVSTGNTHTCAVTSAGAAKCWGLNSSGQLGNGNKTSSNKPVTAMNTGAVSVGLGSDQSCAVTSAGGLKCWGLNQYGALGNGTTTDSSVPVDVIGLPGAIAFVKGGYRQTCSLTTSGLAYCWGYNNAGQLGNNTLANTSVPKQVSNVTGLTALSERDGHVCVINSSGGDMCWGYNQYGALGDNTTAQKLVATQVSGLTSGVVAVAAGYRHSCALLSSGSLKCWGYNNAGQLGNNTTNNSLVPVDVLN